MTHDPATPIQRCINRLRAGQADAREELFRVAQGRLRAMVRRLMRSYPALRRWEQSDDVLQNVEMKLLRCVDECASSHHFLCLAAVNIRRGLIDLMRKYYGSQGLGENLDSPGAGEGPDGRPDHRAADPATLAELAELHEQIGLLPDPEREVFDLHVYHGLTLPETAAELGVCLSTVKERWARGRARLARLLGREATV